MHSQDGSTVTSGLAPFDFGTGGTGGGRRGNSNKKPVKASADAIEPAAAAKVQPKGTRFQSKDR